MTGRPLLGVLLALLVESPNRVNLRWDFNGEAGERAWQFTTIGIGIATVLIFLEGGARSALPDLLTWLPALLLPMQFVQSFGLNPSLALNSFSFLAKQRRRRNLRLGLTESSRELNFGNVYFLTILVAATLGRESNSRLFLPGVLVLTAFRLLGFRRRQPLRLIMILSVAGMIALVGQAALDRAANQFGNSAPSRSSFNPNSVSTRVGRPGRVELSPTVVWRLRPQGNSPMPALLRTATYSTFYGATWLNQRVAGSDFKELNTFEPASGEVYQLLAENPLDEAKKAATRADLPRFNLRGTALSGTPLALPGDAASLRDFTLNSVERNAFGTIRVFPKQAVIEGTVIWKGGSNPENPPVTDEDLRVPSSEHAALLTALNDLHLEKQENLKDKLGILRGWFAKDFQYTRNLTIQSSQHTGASQTAIERFLTDVRSGHCEYFATAAVLLLREAGIPARYATGYAVVEQDLRHREFVIRGTHGHAWCRVWDGAENRWVDFDPTPGDSFLVVAPDHSLTRVFEDNLKRLREDFFLWRTRKENQLTVAGGLATVGVFLALFVAKKLWKTRRRITLAEIPLTLRRALHQTPLNALEPPAEKYLGPRPPGLPLAAWLKLLCPQHIDSTALDEAIELHQRHRFDTVSPDRAELNRLAELARQLELALKRRRISRG